MKTQRRKCSKINIRSVIGFRIVSMIGAVLLAAGLIPVPASADGTATDYLTIMVGYWGMSEDDYIEKARYHWTELDDEYGGALPTHYEAYSFFRSGSDGDYNTVIDSARGFYIEDLLNLAGIKLNDVTGVSFYTEDQEVGYFTSFSYSELFSSSRYYFNDLSYYVIRERDEDDNPIDYEIDPESWYDMWEVRPMLALEDRWETYGSEYEGMHTDPNWTGMGAGNRFRLLFGQNAPDEMRTSQTAKYTHALYVALEGTPKVVDDLGPIESKIGSDYRLEFRMSTDDDSFNDILREMTSWASTNEEVLKITDVSMTQNAEYADVLDVAITYDILSEGYAEIAGSFMGISMEGNTVGVSGVAGGNNEDETGPGGDDGQDESGDAGNNGEDESGNGKDSTDNSGKNPDENAAKPAPEVEDVTDHAPEAGGEEKPEAQTPQENSADNSNEKGADESGQENTGPDQPAGSDNNSRQDANNNRQPAETEDAYKESEAVPESEEATAQEVQQTEKVVYLLNEEIGRQLREEETEPETIQDENRTVNNTEYEKLEVKISEMNPIYGRILLIASGVLLLLGGMTGEFRFRKRLRS